MATIHGSTERAANRGSLLRRFLRQWDLQLMAIPGILFILVFAYIPMWGLLIAFQEYNLFLGVRGSTWVGLDNFRLFFDDPNFWNIMRNTIGISVLKLVFGFPAPILLALMINEILSMRFKRVFQTISYLPHFVSWVIVSGLVFSLLSTDGGSFNMALQGLGLIEQPVNWLSQPRYFWTILVSTNVWKGVGFGAIIYLAAIASINPELYDAASVDGANRFRQMLLITLPGITPVIVIFLILNISQILNAGFEDILLLTNNGRNAILRPVSEVIDTYVFRVGIQHMRFSYATAAGFFRSVVSVLLLVMANSISRKISDSSLW